MAFEAFRQRIGSIIGGFDAAQAHRRLRGFRASRAHVNTLIAASGDTITARARWLVRNNGYCICPRRPRIGNEFAHEGHALCPIRPDCLGPQLRQQRSIQGPRALKNQRQTAGRRITAWSRQLGDSGMKPVEPVRFAVKGTRVEADPRGFDTVRKGACISMTGTTQDDSALSSRLH